jgi:hypothetical protein
MLGCFFFLVFFLRVPIDDDVDELICARIFNTNYVTVEDILGVVSRQHDKSSFFTWHAGSFRLAYPSNRTIELKLTSGRSIYPCEGKRGGKKLAFIDSHRDSYILQRAYKPRVLQPVDHRSAFRCWSLRELTREATLKTSHITDGY